MSREDKDPRERMQYLLTLTTEKLIEFLERGEATSADFNAATKLLKDNSIDVSLSQSDTMAQRLGASLETVPFPAKKING